MWGSHHCQRCQTYYAGWICQIFSIGIHREDGTFNSVYMLPNSDIQTIPLIPGKTAEKVVGLKGSLSHRPKGQFLIVSLMIKSPLQRSFSSLISKIRNGAGIINRSRKHRGSYLQFVIIMLCLQSARTGLLSLKLGESYRLRQLIPIALADKRYVKKGHAHLRPPGRQQVQAKSTDS